jgi:hypothetical protein
MPVSKRPRNKQPQKKKKVVPFNKLTGYRVVADTIKKVDEILVNIALVTRALPNIEAKFSPEDKGNCTLALEHMRKALSNTVNDDSVVVNGIPAANRNLHARLQVMSERPHVKDEDFVNLMGEAEWLMSRIAHDLLTPLADLTDLVNRYSDDQVETPAPQDAEHV